MHKLLAFCLALCVSSSSSALEFHENPATGEILATGRVQPDDAEKITRLITLEFRQRHRNVRGLVTISFDSPGGSLLGGIRLGYALRKLGVHSHIGARQSCLSACALAFLGGRERTVEGAYGVHAASLDTKAKQSELSDILDTIQYLGAITTAYVTEMTGRNEVAIRALSTAASEMSVLSDAELMTMGVITMARRPSQFGRPGFKCPTEHNFTVLSAVCVHLDIAALDQDLNALHAQILASDAPRDFEADQERWRRYRNSCINDGSPNGYASVVHCVREAYLVRRDQLTSIWLAISARRSRPVAGGWSPIAPAR